MVFSSTSIDPEALWHQHELPKSVIKGSHSRAIALSLAQGSVSVSLCYTTYLLSSQLLIHFAFPGVYLPTLDLKGAHGMQPVLS